MPVYSYRCEECGEEYEAFHYIDDRHNETHCGRTANRLISKSQSRPIVMDYYSEGADAYFTGPKQKERVLREKGLTDVTGSIAKYNHTIGRKEIPVETIVKAHTRR